MKKSGSNSKIITGKSRWLRNSPYVTSFDRNFDFVGKAAHFTFLSFQWFFVISLLLQWFKFVISLKLFKLKVKLFQKMYIPIFHHVSSTKNECKIDHNINHEGLSTIRINFSVQFLISLLKKWHDDTHTYLLKFYDL